MRKFERESSGEVWNGDVGEMIVFFPSLPCRSVQIRDINLIGILQNDHQRFIGVRIIEYDNCEGPESMIVLRSDACDGGRKRATARVR
jgi:hypothetical protein